MTSNVSIGILHFTQLSIGWLVLFIQKLVHYDLV